MWEKGLEAALGRAIESRDSGGIPIGAALVDEGGNVVASGHNERVQSGDPTAHAEIACIRNAGRREDWDKLTLVSTLSPCAMCTGSAVLFRFRRVVVGENRSFMGREDWLKQNGIEVVVADDPRCVALMEAFTAKHPELWDEDIGFDSRS